MTNLLKRYSVATLGLILVSLGVAVSLKSNLGTSPISCPPAVLNLRWSAISFGQFAWAFNFSLIFLQLLILRRKFRWADLMQIPAVILFGAFCDLALWLVRDLPTDGIMLQYVWCFVAIIITAVGLRIEINGNAWMLSGDKTVAVIADASHLSFSTIKVWTDIFLVIFSALFAWLCFSHLFGDGTTNVIREGTLLLAVLTGLCMKLTDPLVNRLFPADKFR